jgi:hypothetical protein
MVRYLDPKSGVFQNLVAETFDRMHFKSSY